MLKLTENVLDRCGDTHLLYPSTWEDEAGGLIYTPGQTELPSKTLSQNSNDRKENDWKKMNKMQMLMLYYLFNSVA